MEGQMDETIVSKMEKWASLVIKFKVVLSVHRFKLIFPPLRESACTQCCSVLIDTSLSGY